mgnify:FL=1
MIEAFQRASVSQFAAHVSEDSDYTQKALEQEYLYRSPKGYVDWKIHLRSAFASGAAVVTTRAFQSSDLIGVLTGNLSHEAIMNNAPARYISKEMCLAFAQTATPVLTKDILNVLPYMHIILPRHTIYDHHGDEVYSLIVKTGCVIPHQSQEEIEFQREIGKTVFPNEAIIPDSLIGASGVEVAVMTSDGASFWREFIDENAKSWHEETVKNMDSSGYTRKETECVMRIAINSLLVHLYEPGLITTDKPVAASGAGFAKSASAGKSQLSPTWIGKSFIYNRETKSAKDERENKASVRSHWRRGHWHTVLHGPKRSERRVQWFKPVYVNAEG